MRRHSYVWLGVVWVAAVVLADTPAPRQALVLRTEAFAAGGRIPVRHTADGDDLSPALTWSSPSEATKSFALICDDPDAPRGTWTHWVIFDLPAGTRMLPEGVPAVGALQTGGHQGKNDFGTLGYRGPAPPPGKPHRYFFRLYALNATLGLQPGCSRREVEKGMEGHVVARAEIHGLYAR